MKEALPLQNTSAAELAQAIAHTKLAVSTTKTAVDENATNARSTAASDAAVDAADEDLAEGLGSLNALKEAQIMSETTHQAEVLKLEALTKRQETLLSERSFWEGTLKEAKCRIVKRKKEHIKNKKRANPGTISGVHGRKSRRCK